MLIQGPLCWISADCLTSSGLQDLTDLCVLRYCIDDVVNLCLKYVKDMGKKCSKNCLLSFSQYGRTLLKKMSCCSKKRATFFF